MEGNSKHCKALRKDGSPCRVKAVRANGYCVMHDPVGGDKLRAIRSAGGKGKSNQARAARAIPADLLGVRDGLLAAFAEVRDGTLEPQQATALGALARAIVAVHQAGEVDQRITELEARVAAGRR